MSFMDTLIVLTYLLRASSKMTSGTDCLLEEGWRELDNQ